MSFTTRCPACGTVFRVVADQLKISDGWVRCGHCSDVFDATIHLQAWVPAAKPPATRHDTVPSGAPASSAHAASESLPEPSPAPASMAEPVPMPASITPPADPLPAEVPDDDDLRAWFGDGPLDPPSAAASPPQAEPDEQLADPTPPVEPETASGTGTVHDAANDLANEVTPLDAPPLQAAASSPEQSLAPDFQAELERFAQTVRSGAPVAALPASAREDRATQARENAGSQSAEVAEDDQPMDGAVPGFMRQARRRAFWASPGVRAALGVVALVLAALLAAQWAIQQRHQLVAAYPQARPWMEKACSVIGCDLAPIRRIDAVEIESAELVRRLGNFYSFDFVLRNRSSLEVATPALELTLTGLGNQTMARRVFLPQDWPDAPTALPPGGTVSVSLRLALMLGDDAPTAGYRAVAFYP